MSRNAFEASRRGTELVSPDGGVGAGESHEGEGDGPPPLTAADFQIKTSQGSRPRCAPPATSSIEEYELKDAPERVEVHFAGTTCEPCPLRSRCPGSWTGVRGPVAPQGGPGEGEHRAAPEGRGPPVEWCKRYDIRAGIEGTNSELKRAHQAWDHPLARGPSGAACRLPEGVGVQLQADGPCTPGGDGGHGSAGGRDGTCGRGRMRAPPKLHNFHRVP